MVLGSTSLQKNVTKTMEKQNHSRPAFCSLPDPALYTQNMLEYTSAGFIEEVNAQEMCPVKTGIYGTLTQRYVEIYQKSLYVYLVNDFHLQKVLTIYPYSCSSSVGRALD